MTGSTPALLLDTGRAVQQPNWENRVHLERVRSELSELPALIGADEIRTLRTLLNTVAQGRATVIQAGDCAEDPQESTDVHVARKVALLNVLAGTMRMKTHRPVLRVGRIGGQYAKPRSKPTEMVNGIELPSFRGHLVNGPQPHPVHRRSNPDRMLAGYWAANRVMGHLGWRVPSSLSVIEPPVWTSHEALLLDYEVPQLRRDGEGRMVLTSTHWPWIGDRTRHLDGPHVDLFSRIANPVACKVGPSMTSAELLALCDKLDPERESGRLTLIARQGASKVRSALPELVAAVRDSGHPVIWLCDPLHANTVSTDSGYKTRHVQTAVDEVQGFREVLAEAGVHAGGLHLETTPDDVTECVYDDSLNHEVGQRYSTLCDPRLNTEQATEVVSAW